jgi:hypothetical protein
MKLVYFIKNKNRFIYFLINSLGILLIKLLILYILEFIFSPASAYGITHILILIISYLVHCKITFKVDYCIKNFLIFFQSVLLFKLVDYCIFMFFIYKLSINSLFLVTCISFLIFIFRFFILKKIFIKRFE